MSNSRVNSIRVAPPHWLDEDKLEKLLCMLEEYPCSIEQIQPFEMAVVVI